ncbi:MAG: MarR family winged helix-turn-helix transcriptional regulator [Saprospiraceae bacterium]
MPSSNKIVELVNRWAEMESIHPDLTLEGFCWHLLGRMPEYGSEHPYSLNARLAGLAGRLSKFATLYSKKALESFTLNTVEEWVYLVRLQQLGQPKKSELIFELISEFPSGSEIIKRLIKKGLVQEYRDPDDRRSKRIEITPQGRHLVFASFPEMERVGEMAFGILTDNEKIVFLKILEKLDRHHGQHYKAVRQAGFREAYRLLKDTGDETPEFD